MTRRIRSTLYDNTTGKVLVNTDSSGADSNYVAAAVSPRQVIMDIKSPGNSVQVVQASKFWKPSATGLITKVTALLRPYSTGSQSLATAGGQQLTIRLRLVHSDNTGNTYNYSIPADTISASSVTQISFVETDKIYVDVLQVGSSRPGQGLVVYLEYYTG